MKKLFLIAIILFISLSSIYSQKVKVPSAVKDTFNILFPNADNVKWGKESSSEYEAEFKLNDIEMSANFSSDGSWVETETQIDILSLPQPVVDAINRDYSNATISSAFRIDKADKSVWYESDIKVGKKKKEVTYDASGNKQRE